MTSVNTTTTTTKTVFQKAPFRVLATLLIIEGVMIGQVLSRPGEAKEPVANTEVTATSAQDKRQYDDDKDPAYEKNCLYRNPITRRDCWMRKFKAGEKNLTHADLSGADLSGANLRFVDLRDANLVGANLEGADLRGARLGEKPASSVTDGDGIRVSANLYKANLRGAKLSGALLYKVNLEGADLRGADLVSQEKVDGKIPLGVDLRGANLRGVDLRKADLSPVGQHRVALVGADLRDADLRGLDLRETYMRDTKLDGIKRDEKNPPSYRLLTHSLLAKRHQVQGKLHRGRAGIGSSAATLPLPQQALIFTPASTPYPCERSRTALSQRSDRWGRASSVSQRSTRRRHGSPTSSSSRSASFISVKWRPA